MAISPNVDFTAGQILTATQQNQFPRGIVAIATRNTSYAPNTVESDLFSVTFTAVANRYYKYSLFAGGADGSAALYLTSKVTDNANVLLNSSTQVIRGPGLPDLVTQVTIRTETAGSITRKLRMVTNVGNASMGGASQIISWVVEDIGPA
jgi:hypothetical protein